MMTYNVQIKLRIIFPLNSIRQQFLPQQVSVFVSKKKRIFQARVTLNDAAQKSFMIEENDIVGLRSTEHGSFLICDKN